MRPSAEAKKAEARTDLGQTLRERWLLLQNVLSTVDLVVCPQMLL